MTFVEHKTSQATFDSPYHPSVNVPPTPLICLRLESSPQLLALLTILEDNGIVGCNEPLCSICQDDDQAVVFDCGTADCEYSLCLECLRMAFDDGSGSNSRKCPMCKTPTAIKMVEAACGKMAFKAVESEIRSDVEFDVKAELLVRKQQAEEMTGYSDEARRIFNCISEEINLKCPRCKAAFHDYDGCNALKCAALDCEAAFCAICLKDCGSDAHAHLRVEHSGCGLFGKHHFVKATKSRTKEVVADHFARLKGAPDALIQLVKNHVDRAKILESTVSKTNTERLVKTFVKTAKEDLSNAVRNDRLSLLTDRVTAPRQLTRDMVSPRCAVPSNYRLSLTKLRFGSDTYQIGLRKEDPFGQWKEVPVDQSDRDSKEPVIDILSNLGSSLACAVVAIESERCLYQTHFKLRDKKEDSGMNDNTICVSFSRVTGDGRIEEGQHVLDQQELRILGLNPNRRIILLQKYISTTADHDLVGTSIRHMIGVSKPLPLLDRITSPLPKTLNELNPEQLSIAHPLKLKTAMEVAGPPGTGKTKTITEVARSLLSCTDYDVVVMSERNGAIDAIAEKFAAATMSMKKGKVLKINDVEMWLNVMTFGSSGIGEFTKLFTMEEKLKHHPDLVRLRTMQTEQWERSKTIAKHQRRMLAQTFLDLGQNKCFQEYAIRQSDAILKAEGGLCRPIEIINDVAMSQRGIEEIMALGASRMREEKVEGLVETYGVLLEEYIPKRSAREKRLDPLGWQTPENVVDITERMKILNNRLYDILKHPAFERSRADELIRKSRDIDSQLKQEEERLQKELIMTSRLKMCTIGSSHKLPSARQENDSLDDMMAGLNVKNICQSEGKFVAIFDEAGCIPSYELLGLSKLGAMITSLIVVGDSHQLPPFDPSSGNTKRGQPQSRTKKICSLLDASLLSDEAKVKLTRQYRVPRDIAELLNHRVYHGKYQTAATAKVPPRGFHFVNVPFVEHKKYVNENEIEMSLELVRRARRGGYTSILILTPYKKQQREIQYRLKDRAEENLVSVLTIDQCQGQEADVVILSLVRKPTKFLTKNRLNVALSRVREELYLLVDKEQFRKAAKDSSWQCNLLAADLLTMQSVTV